VRSYFDGRIDAIVDGGPTVIKQSSTVVQVDPGGYRVLREGIITREMIHQLLVGKNILFVCSGNSCRSPMAAALFGKLLAGKLGCEPEDLRGIGYTIHSAGTGAFGGGWASANAIAAMEERGLDISGHVSRPVTAEMVREADRIYALSSSHIHRLIDWDPEIEEKVRLLTEGGSRTRSAATSRRTGPAPGRSRRRWGGSWMDSSPEPKSEGRGPVAHSAYGSISSLRELRRLSPSPRETKNPALARSLSFAIQSV